MDLTRQIECNASDYLATVIKLRELCGEDDDALLLGMIEGETTLESLVGSIVSQVAEDESHVEGVIALLRKLGDRRKRLETRAQRLRVLLAHIIDELPDRAYRHPLAHLRAFDVDPRVIVLDESQVPAGYWKVPDPKLDESAIRRHLIERMKRLTSMTETADEDVLSKIRSHVEESFPDIPGVCLGEPEISVRIRMS